MGFCPSNLIDSDFYTHDPAISEFLTQGEQVFFLFLIQTPKERFFQDWIFRTMTLIFCGLVFYHRGHK